MTFDALTLCSDMFGSSLSADQFKLLLSSPTVPPRNLTSMCEKCHHCTNPGSILKECICTNVSKVSHSKKTAWEMFKKWGSVSFLHEHRHISTALPFDSTAHCSDIFHVGVLFIVLCLNASIDRDLVPWWISYSAIVWNYNHLLWDNFYSLFHTRPFFCICTVAWWYWYVAMSNCNQ